MVEWVNAIQVTGNAHGHFKEVDQVTERVLVFFWNVDGHYWNPTSRVGGHNSFVSLSVGEVHCLAFQILQAI